MNQHRDVAIVGSDGMASRPGPAGREDGGHALGRSPGPQGDRATPKPAQPQARAVGPSRKQTIIAIFTLALIGLHIVLRFGWVSETKVYGLPLPQLPLIAALVFGGVPLVLDLLTRLLHREFGSDLLAGMSIVTSVLLRRVPGRRAGRAHALRR